MTLGTLPPGTRFRLACNEREGSVEYQSPAGTCVRWQGRRVRIEDGDGGSTEFESASRPVVLWNGAKVERIT